MVAFNRQRRDRPLSRAIRLLLCLTIVLSGVLLPSQPTQAAPAPPPITRAQPTNPKIERGWRGLSGSTRIESAKSAVSAKSASSAKSAFLFRLEQTPINQACPLFGDADCDCSVAANDIQTYASHWAETNSSPAYNINFDADGDGDVDVSDIQAAAAHLGEVCTPSGLTATITGAVINEATNAAIANARIVASSTAYSTTTDAAGQFALAVPPGDYHLEISATNFTGDERAVSAFANQLTPVQDVRLYPLDSKTAAIGTSGGVITNSLSSSSLAFPAGALATTQEVRVTYLPNDGLPGGFPDGSVPMGFSSFQPEGVVFPQGKEVLWTVAYTGTLPVGTDTLCYWWDGEEERWRDPVPGKVVQLANGSKALQARVPHFSAYGHALPGVAGQRPGQGGDPIVGEANAGKGPDQ